MTRVLFALFTFTCLALIPTSGFAQDLEFPPDWYGIWESTTITSECDGPVLEKETETDTICPGELFTEEDDEGEPLPCTGTIDGDSANLTCTLTNQVTKDCSIRIDVTTSIMRSGNTASGTSTFSITVTETNVGDCFGIEDECETGSFTATRTSTDTSSCPTTAVATASWGNIKSRYN